MELSIGNWIFMMCGWLQSPRPGDYAILVPPVSKADPTGEVWGALPIYLHLQPTDHDCAFSHLAALELALPASGESREHVPLISPGAATPLRELTGVMVTARVADLGRAQRAPPRNARRRRKNCEF